MLTIWLLGAWNFELKVGVCLNVLWCQALTHLRVHNTSDNDNLVFE